jgi:leucyl-tRNA synthetase
VKNAGQRYSSHRCSNTAVKQHCQSMVYDHFEIEKKWQQYWEANGFFRAAEIPSKKFYDLVMFAYPSGDIHMGHCKNYVIGDVISRFKRRQGFDVLHPFGWDAFGLPAENRAIEIGVPPKKWTLDNIKVSDESLKMLGISFDWQREVITCMPDYYRWTQWMFLLLHRRGLAYKKEAFVNWCPGCQTVLANEQVDNGYCYRSNCRSAIEKRRLDQWFFRITQYAERLLQDLDTLTGWPEKVKAMQRNWIGRSEGTNIVFGVKARDVRLEVFTTRPDTIYGVTFISIAPESPLIEPVVKGCSNEPRVREYIKDATMRTVIERAEREKDGVNTGVMAVNPLSGEEIPIFVADYVLAEYGSGVVMGVPAHDARDFQFARKYDLNIRVVINPPGQVLDAGQMTDAFVDHGTMVNSGPYNGMASEDGIKAVADDIAKKGGGGIAVNYHIKDWLISRQRYWGAPIPIIYCPKCGVVPVPEKDLPVLLPEAILDFVPRGKSPLAGVNEFINTSCPTCGGPAQRDPDTMDTFVCSSWYFLRYLDPHNDREFCDRDRARQWLPIDQYTGGIEHATGHLIYFRFFTKVLFDAGYVAIDEPARNLFTQGMVLRNGEVMSKSKGNTIPVGSFVQQHGADVARLTILFAAPPERDVEWSDEGVVGAERFLDRVYRIVTENIKIISALQPEAAALDASGKKLHIKVNQTVAKVTADVEQFKFNTAIAALWELLNELYALPGKDRGPVFGYGLHVFIRLLSPFAPHMAEELWSLTGAGDCLMNDPWPSFDERFTREDTATIVIQINGKVRGHLEVDPGLSEEDIKERAMADEKVRRHIGDRSVKKIVYVPLKIVNIVV